MRHPALSSLQSVFYETPLHSLLIAVAKGLVPKTNEHTIIATAEVLLEFGVDDRQVAFTDKGLKLRVLGLCEALGLTATAEAIQRLRRLLVPRRAGARRRAPLDEQDRLRRILSVSLADSGNFQDIASRAAMNIQKLWRGYVVRKRSRGMLAHMKAARLARELAIEESLSRAAFCLQRFCRAAFLSIRWRRRTKLNPASWFKRFQMPKLPSFASTISHTQFIMHDIAQRVGRLIAAASCRHSVVLEPGAGGTDGGIVEGSRADHVEVVRWYHSTVHPQHVRQDFVGNMVTEDSTEDNGDGKVEGGLMEKERSELSEITLSLTRDEQQMASQQPEEENEEQKGAVDEEEAFCTLDTSESLRIEEMQSSPVSGPQDLTEEVQEDFKECTIAGDMDQMKSMLKSKKLTASQKAILANLPVNNVGTRGVLLHHCAAKGWAEIVQLLISVGAGVDERDDLGNTAVHLCAQGSHHLMIKTLFDRGASLNALNTNLETPLQLAAAAGVLASVNELFLCATGSEQGIECEQQQRNTGMTAFLLACAGAYFECAKLVLEHSPFAAHSFNSQLENGAHLVLRHLAKLHASDEGGKVRAETGAGGGAGGQGETVDEPRLSEEFAERYFQMLVESGCDIFGENRDGDTPAALAHTLGLSSSSQVRNLLNTTFNGPRTLTRNAFLKVCSNNKRPTCGLMKCRYSRN